MVYFRRLCGVGLWFDFHGIYCFGIGEILYGCMPLMGFFSLFGSRCVVAKEFSPYLRCPFLLSGYLELLCYCGTKRNWSDKLERSKYNDALGHELSRLTAAQEAWGMTK